MTIQITKRHSPNLKEEKNIPQYWFGGDAFKTRLYDALSLLFQDGEKFFVTSVKHYFDRITDPSLKNQAHDFIFQESHHNQAHTCFNQHIMNQDKRIDSLIKKSGKLFKLWESILPAKLRLAMTVAAEHITALFAHHGMQHLGVIGDAYPPMKGLYLWHAAEEIEHKAVAFDVFKQAAKGGYMLRIAGMVIQSLVGFFHIPFLLRSLLRIDGKNRFKVWFHGFKWLLKRNGFYLWGKAKSYFVFYSPNFDPWKVGDLGGYKVWVETYNKTNGDFIVAAEAVTDFQEKEKIKKLSTGLPYLSLSTNNQGVL